MLLAISVVRNSFVRKRSLRKYSQHFSDEVINDHLIRVITVGDFETSPRKIISILREHAMVLRYVFLYTRKRAQIHTYHQQQQQQKQPFRILRWTKVFFNGHSMTITTGNILCLAGKYDHSIFYLILCYCFFLYIGKQSSNILLHLLSFILVIRCTHLHIYSLIISVYFRWMSGDVMVSSS